MSPRIRGPIIDVSVQMAGFGLKVCYYNVRSSIGVFHPLLWDIASGPSFSNIPFPTKVKYAEGRLMYVAVYVRSWQLPSVLLTFTDR